MSHKQSHSEADHFDSPRVASGETTLPRRSVLNNSLSVGSGTLRLTYFTASKTETVTQVKMVTGSTAAGATPTLVRMGIYTVDPSTGDITLAASTPNDTSLLAATATAYTKALSASLAKTAGTKYALGLIVVTGAAAPTMAGLSVASLPAAELALDPRLCAFVSGQTDLPASVAAGSLSNTSQIFYGALLP